MPKNLAGSCTVEELSDSMITGSVTVGAAIVPVIDASVPVAHVLILKAAKANTGIIYIGTSAVLTAGSAGATDGYPLSAGDEVKIPLTDVGLLKAIASAATQKLFWAAL